MLISEIDPPETSPVTLAQVKQHLRIDHDEDNGYLSELIEAARLHVEAVSGHALIFRSLRQYCNEVRFSNSIRLMAYPVQTVVAVTGYDPEGHAVTLQTDQYMLKQTHEGALVQISDDLNDASFPNGLEIDFITGHGESGVDLPSNITRAILVLIAHWYEYRGALAPGEETAIIPAGLDKLLAPVKRVHL